MCKPIKEFIINSMERGPAWKFNSNSASQEYAIFYVPQRFIVVFTTACIQILF